MRYIPRLKGGAKSSRREGRSVRLSLYQLLAMELQDRLAAVLSAQKAVVLLRGNSGKRLEPVCKMRCSSLYRPFLHCFSDLIGYCRVERSSCVNSFMQLLVDIRREHFFHDMVVKYLAAEIFDNIIRHISSRAYKIILQHYIPSLRVCHHNRAKIDALSK